MLTYHFLCNIVRTLYLGVAEVTNERPIAYSNVSLSEMCIQFQARIVLPSYGRYSIC